MCEGLICAVLIQVISFGVTFCANTAVFFIRKCQSWDSGAHLGPLAGLRYKKALASLYAIEQFFLVLRCVYGFVLDNKTAVGQRTLNVHICWTIQLVWKMSFQVCG